MDAKEARARIDANRANALRRLSEDEKLVTDKTIAYWETVLVDWTKHGVGHRSGEVHSSNWLARKFLARGELSEAIEQSVQAHFQARGIAFKKTVTHAFMCDCGLEEGCRVFYYLDVS